MIDRIPLVPVFRPGVNEDKFSTKVAPSIKVVEGISISTAPLLPGIAVDIMGLSHHDELHDRGVTNYTDAIADDITLSKIYIEVDGQVHESLAYTDSFSPVDEGPSYLKSVNYICSPDPERQEIH